MDVSETNLYKNETGGCASEDKRLIGRTVGKRGTGAVLIPVGSWQGRKGEVMGDEQFAGDEDFEIVRCRDFKILRRAIEPDNRDGGQTAVVMQSAHRLLVLVNMGVSCRLAVHAHQEFIVVFSLFQTVFYEIHSLNRVHVGKIFAQNPHAVESCLVKQ